ncbi:MAG: hypothetical protein RL481_179 [Pseudomonadota bacterium]
MKLLITLALALAASSTASAAVDASANKGSTEAKPTKPKKICKSSKQDTGSRITKKTCKTQEQWEKDNNDNEVRMKGRSAG